MRRSRLDRSARLALALLVVVTGACGGDDASARLYARDPATARWVRDSLLLETKPNVLLRVLPDGSSSFVVPIATIGAEGIRELRLSEAGWRRLDTEYLHAGRLLHGHHAARTVAEYRMFRGMWQPGVPPLDSLGCSPVIPMARALTPESLRGAPTPRFATTGERPPLPHERTLDDGAVSTLLGRIPLLVAPTEGISPSDLRRYRRRVTQVPSGINGGSSLVVEYNDDTPLPAKPRAAGERPRQLIVVLDQGAFDYRPTFTWSTTGQPGAQPKLTLLDFLDTDTDGVPELLFGLLEAERAALFTMVVRYDREAWREVFRFTGNRCDT